MPKVSNCWNRARTKQSLINRFSQLEMAGSLPLQAMRLESMRTDRNIKGSSRLSSDERRRAIIESVKGVFAEKGFDGTTTRELAKAAGVSEALLYLYFPSKHALYDAMLAACAEAPVWIKCNRIR